MVDERLDVRVPVVRVDPDAVAYDPHDVERLIRVELRERPAVVG